MLCETERDYESIVDNLLIPSQSMMCVTRVEQIYGFASCVLIVHPNSYKLPDYTAILEYARTRRFIIARLM